MHFLLILHLIAATLAAASSGSIVKDSPEPSPSPGMCLWSDWSSCYCITDWRTGQARLDRYQNHHASGTDHFSPGVHAICTAEVNVGKCPGVKYGACEWGSWSSCEAQGNRSVHHQLLVPTSPDEKCPGYIREEDCFAKLHEECVWTDWSTCHCQGRRMVHHRLLRSIGFTAECPEYITEEDCFEFNYGQCVWSNWSVCELQNGHLMHHQHLVPNASGIECPDLVREERCYELPPECMCAPENFRCVVDRSKLEDKGYLYHVDIPDCHNPEYIIHQINAWGNRFEGHGYGCHLSDDEDCNTIICELFVPEDAYKYLNPCPVPLPSPPPPEGQ